MGNGNTQLSTHFHISRKNNRGTAQVPNKDASELLLHDKRIYLLQQMCQDSGDLRLSIGLGFINQNLPGPCIDRSEDIYCIHSFLKEKLQALRLCNCG